MYIPHINNLTDKTKILAFMRRFSFATLVTSSSNRPVATHLPFLVEEREDKIILVSHLAKQNEQAEQLEQETSLVIFSEPHAYISPTHYEKELNVPTWNYIAVHAYGQAKLVKDDAAVMKLLEHTIQQYEPAYQQQWEGLPEKYRYGLIQGIIAFEIEVTELQGKEKLSQNKTKAEQLHIVTSLSNSEDSAERVIAEYMQRNLDDAL